MIEITHAQLVAALVKPGADILVQLTPDKVDLIHAAIGISGEAGELLDAIKKTAVYNKPLDVENVIEELGDLRFYMEQMRQRISKLTGREISWAEIEASNIEKLQDRYKDLTYTDQAAQDRADKAHETPRKFFGQQREEVRNEAVDMRFDGYSAGPYEMRPLTDGTYKVFRNGCFWKSFDNPKSAVDYVDAQAAEDAADVG